MRWIDSSVREIGERLTEPNRMHIEGQAIRIIIHKNLRGTWYAETGLGMWATPLRARTARDARHEAIETIQTKIESMLADIHQMKGVTV